MTGRTILCFGDSNTHGTVALSGPEEMGRMRRFDPATRWPGVMAAALGPDDRVIEEGLPGRTTAHDDPVEGAHMNGLAVLPAILGSHRPLDVVIVMLGTNDCKARFALPALDIALGAGLLLEAAARLAPEARRLLVAPVPLIETEFLGEMFAGGADKSRALAPRMRDEAARRGAGFTDLAGVATVDPTDGIHMTAEAHGAIGAHMAGAIA